MSLAPGQKGSAWEEAGDLGCRPPLCYNLSRAFSAQPESLSASVSPSEKLAELWFQSQWTDCLEGEMTQPIASSSKKTQRQARVELQRLTEQMPEIDEDLHSVPALLWGLVPRSAPTRTLHFASRGARLWLAAHSGDSGVVWGLFTRQFSPRRLLATFPPQQAPRDGLSLRGGSASQMPGTAQDLFCRETDPRASPVRGTSLASGDLVAWDKHRPHPHRTLQELEEVIPKSRGTSPAPTVPPSPLDIEVSGGKADPSEKGNHSYCQALPS